MTDRIPVRIGELTFWISPLSAGQKGILLAQGKMVSGEETEEAMRGAALVLKFSVKGVDGCKDATGGEYKCEFDPDGCLTDDCVSEILQLDGCAKLVRLANEWAVSDIRSADAMRNAYVEKITALRESGKLTAELYDSALKLFPLDGVEVDFKAIKSVKKKEPAPN